MSASKQNRTRVYSLICLGLAFLLAAVFDSEAGNRGLDNNNPGNIERGYSTTSGMTFNNEWLGEATICKDKRFECFDDASYGVRAIVKILQTYSAKYGLNTIDEIIHRYSPPGDNNTQREVWIVVQRTGIGKNTPLDLTDYSTVRLLVDAIIFKETGHVYTDSTVSCGIISAGVWSEEE